jgi:hypothetical protein|tara:strand:- start:2837 stop:3013 length:177 start_codon:yes stop_codon:yes gene_type:complete
MIDSNALSDAVLNMYDIREALSDRVKNKSLHEPTTDYTIGDCLDDVILFLEQLEETNQ